MKREVRERERTKRKGRERKEREEGRKIKKSEKERHMNDQVWWQIEAPGTERRKKREAGGKGREGLQGRRDIRM